MRFAFASLLLAASALPLCAQPARSPAFPTLVDQYLSQVMYPFSPSSGTSAGLHQYDTRLEDYAPATIAQEIALTQDFQHRFQAVDPTTLTPEAAADREIVLANLAGSLLTLQTICPWDKNPDVYSSGITSSAFSIMERPYAPVDDRLRSLIARERQMPHLLDEARTNLKNPPRVFTEIALEQIDGNIGFFQHDVPLAFADATDPALKAEFARTNAAVVAALQSYGAWMKSDLLPRSNGDFRLGADTFRKLLADNEMVDTPLDRLLAIAYADAHKNQAEFARVAKEVDPTKTPAEVLAELGSFHPAAGQLLQTFHDQFTSLIAFIDTRHVITIPSKVEPTLEETPPFMRATTQASMDPPGPFETHSTKAYFNVTLPEPNWTAAHTQEFLTVFNVGTITSTAVHEAYPGHYVQFLWQPQFPSTVRKVFGANTNIEGWAHYCEQMMLDAGYLPPLTGTPAEQQKQARLIRLGQLQDALLRDARFIVAIRMHTGVGGALTPAQAEQVFVTEGYQSLSVGQMETKRGSSDALYLYYTLGKLEILKLRADVEARQGASFNLQQFHDAFMHQGFAPIRIIRRAMLGDDSPAL